MTTSAPTNVNELSDCYVIASYFDLNGVPYTPTAVSWRLWDDTNKILIQDWTAIASPGLTNQVDIPGAMNVLGNSKSLTERHLVTFRVTAPGGAIRYDTAVLNIIAFPDVP